MNKDWPTTTKLGIHTYTVSYPDQLINRDTHQPLFGRVLNEPQTIELLSIMQPSRLFEVLLHEQLHVIADDFGMDLGEDAVRQLTMGLSALLTNNPHIYGTLFLDIWEG